MADYCKQCSVELFGEDFGDFAGLVSPYDAARGMGACVLCEGCGSALVDNSGKCWGGCSDARHYLLGGNYESNRGAAGAK